MADINVAWLTTNRSCNNKCTWCYAQEAHYQIMPLEKAQYCVDQLHEIGVNRIVLIGGEPTIYPDIFTLMQYIRDKDMKVSIATNGRKFSDLSFARSCLSAGATSINISLKALSEEEYYRDTGCGGLNEAILGYKNLISLGFKPTWSYVIVDSDHDKILRLIRLMEDNGLDNMVFQFVKPVIKKGSEPIMDLREMGEMVCYLYQTMKQSRIKYKIEVSFPLCLIDEPILDSLIDENKIVTCCHIQSGKGIVFDSGFKVLPCNHFVDMPFTESPVIEKEEIKQLWKSTSVSSFRDKVRTYPSKTCASCSRWDICGGGCFTRWLFVNPDDIIPKHHI